MRGIDQYYALLKKKAENRISPSEEVLLQQLGEKLNLREDVFKSNAGQNLGKTLRSGRI